MPTRPACVVFDAEQPRVVARFWAEVLGWEVTVDRPGHAEVAAPDPDAPDVALTFLPAREPKSGKNRMHLDLSTRSLEHQRAQVDRALALGARRVDIGQGTVPWSVLADPEGNEFCVLEPRPQYLDTGAVAAIVVDTHDPARLARFWSVAAGWPLTHDEDHLAALRSPTQQGPWLEFPHNPDPARTPGRLRLDLTTYTGDDLTTELTRLTAAGAVLLHANASHGRFPAALADPETAAFGLHQPLD